MKAAKVSVCDGIEVMRALEMGVLQMCKCTNAEAFILNLERRNVCFYNANIFSVCGYFGRTMLNLVLQDFKPRCLETHHVFVLNDPCMVHYEDENICVHQE